MEITHLPNKGKTYQLFDKDRPNGKDKYFKADKLKSASVKVDGQNTAIMLNKYCKYDFMV